MISSGLATIGIALGQFLAIKGFFAAVNRQPAARVFLTKLMFYGLFAIELSFVLSFVVSMMILFKPTANISYQVGLAELFISLSLLLTSLMISLAAGKTISFASLALARLPQHESKLTSTFFILLTFIETPMLLCFVTSLIILGKINPNISINEGYKLASAALTIGLGSIGPSLSQIIFTKEVCRGMIHRFINSSKIFSLSIFSEVLIETSFLFSFIISIFLAIMKVNPAFDTPYTGMIYFAIAGCISLGTFGTTVAISIVGSRSIKEIAEHMSHYNSLFKNAVLSQILIETYGIFTCIISLIMLFETAIL
jgi:F0F1-type ATP synthase membrane subunit c/vacuolar-type H+-ATPase subunit K